MRELLWQSLLDADMNVRYWDEMIRVHVAGEQRLRIWLAVLSSGTSASLILSVGAEWLWKSLSAVTALLSIYMSVVNASRPVERMAGLKKAWAEALSQYEHLWAAHEDGSVSGLSRKFERVRLLQIQGTADESQFPRNDALLKRCQRLVRQSRGI